jgi:hypothetical protein
MYKNIFMFSKQTIDQKINNAQTLFCIYVYCDYNFNFEMIC